MAPHPIDLNRFTPKEREIISATSSRPPRAKHLSRVLPSLYAGSVHLLGPPARPAHGRGSGAALLGVLDGRGGRSGHAAQRPSGPKIEEADNPGCRNAQGDVRAASARAGGFFGFSIGSTEHASEANCRKTQMIVS